MAENYLNFLSGPAVTSARAYYYGASLTGHAEEPHAHDLFGAEESAFIAQRDSFYLSSISESGWPYLQHRGGPAGFYRCSVRIRSRLPICGAIANC